VLSYLVVVVHAHGNTGSFKVIDNKVLLLRAISRGENQLQTTGSIDNEVGGLVLVAEGVTSQDDRLSPARNQLGDVFAENGLTENGASQNVTDSSLSDRKIMELNY